MTALMKPSDMKPETEATETSAEARRRQRTRSIAIALALGFLVLLFYAATIVRLGGNVLNRPM